MVILCTVTYFSLRTAVFQFLPSLLQLLFVKIISAVPGELIEMQIIIHNYGRRNGMNSLLPFSRTHFERFRKQIPGPDSVL